MTYIISMRYDYHTNEEMEQKLERAKADSTGMVTWGIVLLIFLGIVASPAFFLVLVFAPLWMFASNADNKRYDRQLDHIRRNMR
jgi:hypothetical protein